MTIPLEEVEGYIKDMGYIIATPRTVEPSYYKLKDGTIIKALIHVNYAILSSGPVPDTPHFAINSTNNIAVYVPKDKRSPTPFQPFNTSDLQSAVIDDDMEPEPLRENFSVYDLSNGTVLSVKTIVGQIGKTKFYTRDGEPVYHANMTPIVKTTKQPRHL